MAIRVTISFKEDTTDIELYNYLQEKAEIIGTSAYIKTLLKESLNKEENSKK